MPHVLLIPQGFYGVESYRLSSIFEEHQAAALKMAGYQVGVVSSAVIPAKARLRRVPFLPFEEYEGVPVYRSYRRRSLPARWETHEHRTKRTFSHLIRLVDDYVRVYGKPDIVHAHNILHGGALASELRKELGLPYVVTEHTGDYSASIDRVREDAHMLLPVVECSQKIITVGKTLRRSLSTGLFGRSEPKIVHVPNVVDPRFLDSPVIPGGQRRYITGIGSLIESKNYALLIESFAASGLQEQYDLRIFGNGPQRRSLQSLIHRLHLEEHVTLPGSLSRRQVIEVLDGSAFFAHPSLKESFGVVLIEALARGVPVVAVSSDGPTEILDDELGLLSAPDVQSFSAQMRRMAEMAGDWDRAGTQLTAQNRYGPKAIAQALGVVYAEALCNESRMNQSRK